MTPVDQKAVTRILDQIDYDFIEGPAQAKALARRVEELVALGGFLGVDTETTGLDPRRHQVRLIQIGSKDFALVVDLNGWRTEGKRQVDWSRPGLRELKALLESNQPKVLQNAAFDLNFLIGEQVNLGGYIFDTMIAAKIINNGTGAKNDLGSIAHRELGLPLEKQLQKSDWSGELTAEQVKYAARDVVCLPWIQISLLAKLKSSRLVPSVSLNDVFQLEMKALRPITMMQWHGFGFDVVKAHALKLALQQRAGELKLVFLEALDEAIKARFPTEPDVWLPRNADGSYNTNEREVGSIRLGTKVYAGFNPRSVQQMATRFEQAGIILPKDKAGKSVMDQNLLAFLRADFKLIREYLDWKEVATRGSAVETLIKSVGGDGRIHASYRQLGAETGRLSCIAEGQRVLAPNGPIPIEDVQVGDFVYSLDENGKPAVKRVLNKWCNGMRPVVRVKWEAKGHRDPKYGSLVCTPDHLIRTDEGWVQAQDLASKQTVWHLRRSTNYDRPRLYWRNYGCATEQVIIKESYFDKSGGQWHIHHIDHDKTNNTLSNLEVLSRSEHTSHHARSNYPHWLFTKEAQAKSRANNTPRCGADNPSWISLSKFALLRMLAVSRGRLTYVPMDFDTYKSKCQIAGIDLPMLTRRYSSKGIYLNKRNVSVVYSALGTIEHAANCLGISTRKLNALMLQFGMERTNHRILSVEPAGTQVVYDLEIEDTHNFIVEEVCVHNCVGPNLQQVPREREFRELFVAGEGNVLVVADFSQVELRVAAELSGEPRMLEAYLAGRDLHTETAALMRGVPLDQVTKADRTSAKVANFGLLYGAGPATLRKQAVSQYGIDMSIGEAREIVENFRRAYPRLYDYQLGVGEAVTNCIYTKYGRRRIVVGTFNDKFTVRNNTPVQGTAGDIAKIAMAKLWEHLVQAQPGEARLIAMVHDEIVLEVRADVKDRWSETVVSCMESAGALVCQRVPIVAEVSSGTTWADAK